MAKVRLLFLLSLRFFLFASGYRLFLVRFVPIWLAWSLCAVVPAFGDVWQPAAGHVQVPIWPGSAPDSLPQAGPEFSAPETTQADKIWLSEQRVSRPTMTVYPAQGTNTGAAIVVFPGGGYHVLAIDLEGTEFCHWFAAHGITAVLLKYRVPNSGPHWDDSCHCHRDALSPSALQDAQRTLGLVRARAAEWHVDPHRVGVIGTSAGGHLVADISTHWAKRAYAPLDAADAQSCRPDFAIALYPGHLLEHQRSELELNPTIPVTSETPPTFLCQAMDDSVDSVSNSIVYELALQKAGVPVETHLFAHGGHAFGLRRAREPVGRWPEMVIDWLRTIGILPNSR